MPITFSGSGSIVGDTAIQGNVTATGSHTLTKVPNYRNTPNIAGNYIVTTSFNELSVGPITINDGVSVTIEDGANWVIV